MENKQLAFLAGRIAFGINFFAHGLVRLPKLNEFGLWMEQQFTKTIIPDFSVYPFAVVLTLAEFVVGLTLILGLKTKTSLLVTMGILSMLMFGSSMQENWKTVGVQMVYVIFNYLMLLHFTPTPYAMDNLKRTKA